ncbi:hypothetical protein [Pseudomonas sp. KBW05]|uniref:hypothetical protein n=1 Tax=Pseudomonas sp. KBW05 TaxID=2153360 RepID=UPI0021158FF6|nr:hypothetical protein [Pseudomonas sp. KBW05]
MDFPKSVPGVGLVNGKFIDEDPLAATPGSLIPSEWGNAVTQEILNVITSAGAVPDEANTGQLLTAIDKKIESSTVSFATQAEAEAGTVTSKVMSPARVFQAIAKVVTQATEAKFGWLKLATQTQTNNGLDDATAVTPKKLASTVQSQAYLAVTTTGTSTAYAIAPNYDAAPYAPNQRFFITFHIASTGAPTLNASGRGNRSLKMFDYSGAKIPAVVYAGQMSDVVCDGLDFIVLDQPPQYFTQDLWAFQPIGALISLVDNVPVPAPPLGNPNYTYIKLTAGDAYNAGFLTSESVSGTKPQLLASAVVSLAGSPFNGATVRLINTEGRFIRAGAPGTIEADQFQGHSFGDPRLGAGYILSTPGNVNISYSTGADYGTVITRIDVATTGVQLAAKTDGTNGTPRIGNETRVKSMGATFYLRIK